MYVGNVLSKYLCSLIITCQRYQPDGVPLLLFLLRQANLRLLSYLSKTRSTGYVPQTFLWTCISNSHCCLLCTHFQSFSIDLTTQTLGKISTNCPIFNLCCRSIRSKTDQYFGGFATAYCFSLRHGTFSMSGTSYLISTCQYLHTQKSSKRLYVYED